MFVTTYGRQLTGPQLRKAAVKPLMRAKRARGGEAHFPEDGKVVRTTNHWTFGWSPTLKRWVATNGWNNGRWFRTKRDLLAYAKRMTQWNWEACA